MNSPIMTAFTILLTVVLYIISRKIWIKTQNALLTPLLLSTAGIILILHYSGITFEQYKPGKQIMTFLLGPATVGLALPLYLNRHILRSSFFPILIGIVCGAVSTLTVAVLLAERTRLPIVSAAVPFW